MSDVLAATGDTWGIPGPVFAMTYAALLIVTTVVAIITIWLIDRGIRRTGTTRQPHPYELAMLSGSRRQVIATALTYLRGAGAIEVMPPPQRLRIAGGLPNHHTPLDAAIYTSIKNRTGLNLGGLAITPAVISALAELPAQAVEAGWRRPLRDRIVGLLGLLWFVPVIALGTIRSTAGSSSGRATEYLSIEIMLAFMAITIIIGCWLNTHRTNSGKQVLKDAKSRIRHLTPSLRPSWRTTGPVAAATAVAVFGASALWAGDPALAQVAQVPATFTGGGGGGGSDGGGGGCGGGGCGG